MNTKQLYEKLNELKAENRSLAETAVTETRDFNEQEKADFAARSAEIERLEETIKMIENIPVETETRAVEVVEDIAVIEERAFADYIMGKATEMRSGEQNVTMANNAAIIPTTIANRIIKEVKDRCPILAGATVYNVKGTLKIPVWGNANTSHNIAVGYQAEFTAVTADAGKFTSVDLGGYLAGALTLVGKSVQNNGAFNVVDFVVSQMAEEIAIWIEGQLLTGTGSSAAQGATATSNGITAAGTAAVTADELIALQAKVKQAYQGNSCWTMHPDTFVAIKKLKDTTNRYLIQEDFSSEFPYRLLGRPVYLSDNMPTMAASAKAILYGDYSGLAVNFRENIGIEVLRERYADLHAIGVLGFFEFDSKVADTQKLAVLTMHA